MTTTLKPTKKALTERVMAPAALAQEVLAQKKVVDRAHGCATPSFQLVADTPAVFYQGTRIYFRPLESSDASLLRRYLNHPEVWSTNVHRPPLSALCEHEWIESLGKNNTEYVFGIIIKENDRLIGTTRLHQIDLVSRSAMLGICIGDVEYQNRGYGSEALRLCLRYGFEELNLNRIALSVYSHNWRAIRMYQRAGFVHEGCLRQAVFRHGQYHDEYRFAMLRDEWEQRDGTE